MGEVGDRRRGRVVHPREQGLWQRKGGEVGPDTEILTPERRLQADCRRQTVATTIEGAPTGAGCFTHGIANIR